MKVLHLSLFLVCLTSPVLAEDAHKLVVNGNSTLHKPADKLSLKIGVVTLNQNAGAAIEANNEQMQQLFQTLKKTGLSENEFQTGSFTVAPQYTPPPKNPPPDWHSTISGYEVRNTLSIHTNRLELAGPLIDAAAKAGANLFEDISFTLQDTQNAQIEAIGKAVQQAKAYAQAAALEAGVKLGDVLEISLNPSTIVPRFYKAERFAMAMGDNSTPIAPGNVEVTASVSMTYELRHP